MATLAAASMASAAVTYDSATGLGGTFTSSTHFAQQISLVGSSPQTINSLVFGVRWNDITMGSQDLFLDFYTGADTSASSADALAPATLLGEFGYGLAAPAANGSYSYSLTANSAAPLIVPAGTVTVEVTMTNAAGNAYSGAIGGRFTTGTLATGSDTGFVWNDTNFDGVFAGSEQTTAIANGTNAHIRETFTTTAVPEPASAGLLALAGGAGLAKRRRRHA